MRFQVSPELDEDKVFLVKRSGLERRFDPEYYKPLYKSIENKIKSSNTTDFLYKVANVLTGSTPAKVDYSDIQTNYPIIKVSSYENDFIELSKVAYTKKLKSSNANSIKGDVYILSSAHQASYVGRFMKYLPIIPEKNTSFVGELLCVRGMENNSKYLFSILNTETYKTLINREKRGQTSHIYPTDIRKIKIPIPSQETQAQIVAKMDVAYVNKKQKEARAKRLLESIDDYLLGELGINLPKSEERTIQSQIFIRHLNEVSGCRFDPFYYQKHYEKIINILYQRNDTFRLIDLLQMLESGCRPKGGVSNIDSGVLSFGGEHVNSECEVEINKPKYISHYFHKLHENTETQLHDLLLIKDGATTGKIGIIKKQEHTGQNINEHLFILRTKKNVNPHYLLNYLNSYIGYILIKREITGGTVTGITRGVVKQLRIIIPSLKKQTEISNHITEIRNQAEQLRQQAKAGLEQAKKEMETIILG